MDKKNRLICGDALLVLQKLPDNSIDSIVTDPPGGINFMGKEWDKDKGGRDVWIEWLTLVMRESLRVLKPGGYALVWSIPRTSHWTATALEDAGFEVRDKIAHLFGASTLVNTFLASLDDEQRLVLGQILESQEPGVLAHIFGSGFPKSTAIDKQIDKMLGKKREVIGQDPERVGRLINQMDSKTPTGIWPAGKRSVDITKPATPEAQRWDGWGTNLKPAYENWILVRKPLAAPTVAKNVLQYGTGGLNIDACRVAHNEPIKPMKAQTQINSIIQQSGRYEDTTELKASGRFPSHLLLSHNPDCVPVGIQKVKANGYKDPEKVYEKKGTVYGAYNPVANGTYNIDGAEEVQAYACTDGCPIAELDRQSGVRKSGAIHYQAGFRHIGIGVRNESARLTEYHRETSEGGASRYFQHFPPGDIPPDDYMSFLYQSKASRANRSANGTVNNTHPTVKSTSLMRWLIRLITPPDGIVLDPFCGSGSTLVAAILENKTFIGIEREREYCNIAQARIKHALQAKRAMIDTPAEGKAG